MKYKVKFRIIGDKPPFTVTLHEDNISEPAVITKTTTSSNMIDYLENTQSYTILPSIDYCVKVVDSINNNVSVCDIAYPDIPPYVENVTIQGIAELGLQLRGSYLYYDDNGDPESGSLFKWYRSDDNKGTNKIQISDVFTQQYTLTNDDVGKYIQFSVTPKNLNAVGDERFSTYRFVKDQSIPEILDFDVETNTLIWSMADNSEASGTWLVERSSDKSTWLKSIAGGSPRQNLLRDGIYNEIMHFRVKRMSTPETEYSNVYSKMVVKQIHNFKHITVNLFGDDTVNPPIGFCGSGNQYTNTIPIYLENENTEIKTGTQLYYKANDGFIRPATQNNINTYEAYGSQELPMGISHVRFYLGNDSPYWTTWNVNPVSGQLTTQNNMCNR